MLLTQLWSGTPGGDRGGEEWAGRGWQPDGLVRARGGFWGAGSLRLAPEGPRESASESVRERERVSERELY